MARTILRTTLAGDIQQKWTFLARRSFAARDVGQNLPPGTEGIPNSEATSDPPGVLTFTTAMALGAIGALGVAGLGVWGVLQLSLGVAKSTGRTLHPAQPDSGFNQDPPQAGSIAANPSEPPKPLSALPQRLILEPNLSNQLPLQTADPVHKSWWTFWR